MAVTANTTTTAQITIQAKEIDLANRFTATWEALTEIMGVMRPIRKAPGTKLVSSKASITLADGEVAEGDEVPLSQATVEPVAFKDLALKKYRKRVTAEAVEKYGAAVAVQKTDDALLNELQGVILDEFYEFALTGTLTGSETSFQMAVSMSIGRVKDKFKKMRLNYGQVVVFANTLDVHRYLGATQISTQTSNGVEYLKNFLGADVLIASSEIPEGKVIAIPADNIVLYYIDPADGDFAALGLEYTTGVGETNLIGVHKEGVYGRASGDTHVLMGMVMWAEYLDAIAVTDINAGG
jgi:hypothetical protein